MKILELKHIVPYIPYGLEVQYIGEMSDDGERVDSDYIEIGEISKLGSVEFRYVNPIYWMDFERGYFGVNSNVFKPLLKPIDHIDSKEFDNLGLSELEGLGVDYIGGGIVYMKNKYGLDLDGETYFFGTDKHLPTIPWDIMQVLLKNHYDVFRLIE